MQKKATSRRVFMLITPGAVAVIAKESTELWKYLCECKVRCNMRADVITTAPNELARLVRRVSEWCMASGLIFQVSTGKDKA